MTYSAALVSLQRKFETAGIESARRQAEWILQDVCRVDRVQLTAHPERRIPLGDWERSLALAARRVRGEPIQYVLGHTDFFGLRLVVTPDVLIPRPETEQLVELLLARTATLMRPRVLDVGTGSGCIALAFRSRRQKARAWGCDAHAPALKVAHQNRTALGLPVGLFQADALRPGFARAFCGILDAIVSNPPYVSTAERAALPREVRDFEPPTALFAVDDPLVFYRAITAEAAAVLRPGGHLLFEVHEDRSGAVAAILDSGGFAGVRVERDFADRDRFVSGTYRSRRAP